MPFNTDDYSKAPWVNGIMTLTHEECVKVKNKCQEIKDGYNSNPNYPTPNDQYVVAHYNESNNYQEAINGDTYNAVERYNPEVNTQGISPEYPDGIIPEPTPEEPETEQTEEETEQAPETEEIPAEETPEETEEAPVTEEEETTEEA